MSWQSERLLRGDNYRWCGVKTSASNRAWSCDAPLSVMTTDTHTHTHTHTVQLEWYFHRAYTLRKWLWNCLSLTLMPLYDLHKQTRWLAVSAVIMVIVSVAGSMQFKVLYGRVLRMNWGRKLLYGSVGGLRLGPKTSFKPSNRNSPGVLSSRSSRASVHGVGRLQHITL